MEIKAPDLGVDSAEVAEILVKVGDTVAENDNVVLVESDKASVEIPSPSAGKISQVFIQVGDTISQGTVLFALEASAPEASPAETETKPPKAEQQESPKSEPAPAAATPAPTVATTSDTYKLPDLGVDSAEVADVLVKVGDNVDANQSLLLVESDKASVEVPAPTAGVIEELLVQVGDTVANGQAFVVIRGASEQASEAPKPSITATPTPTATAPADTPSASDKQAPKTAPKLSEQQVNAKARDVYAGPAVRKLARELGVDISQVIGTALNGRVVKDDLFAYVKGIVQGNKPAPSTVSSVSTGLPPLPDMSDKQIWGEISTQDLTRLQKVSIPQLNYNTYLPQVTQFDLADITDTEALRGQLKGDFKAQGIGLTILAFIVKAVAYALTQHPKFNSHLSDDNTQLIIRQSVNMGIAVATDDGLIVPVIKNTQDKGIKQLAIEIGELAKKARDKKLTAKELQGASFTISSQGNLGGTAFTPLVNFPQVAILGISEASYQPRWTGKDFAPRLMLPLSLSYDHRVINGADAAVFTRYIATLLADPRRILL